LARKEVWPGRVSPEGQVGDGSCLEAGFFGFGRGGGFVRGALAIGNWAVGQRRLKGCGLDGGNVLAKHIIAAYNEVRNIVCTVPLAYLTKNM